MKCHTEKTVNYRSIHLYKRPLEILNDFKMTAGIAKY